MLALVWSGGGSPSAAIVNDAYHLVVFRGDGAEPSGSRNPGKQGSVGARARRLLDGRPTERWENITRTARAARLMA